MPALGKTVGIRRAFRQAADQAVQGRARSRFLGRQSGDLRETRVHRANAVVGSKKQNAFLDPFKDVLQFRVRTAALLYGLFGCRRSEHHGDEIFSREEGSMQAHASSVDELPLASFLDLDSFIPFAGERAEGPLI